MNATSLNEADQYIHQCIDLCRKWGAIEHQAVACAMLARLEQARGDARAVLEAVRAAEQLAAERPLTLRRSIQVGSDLARIWLAQGNLERVSQLVQKNGLKVDDDIPIQGSPNTSSC